MFNSKFKKAALLTAVAVTLVGALVGCGKKEEPVTESVAVNEDVTEAPADDSVVGESVGGSFSWDGVDMSNRIAAYQHVIDNMHDFVAASDPEAGEYLAGENYRDYLYFDYDQDGEKEVILYLRHKDENDEDAEVMLDLWYLDYDSEKQEVSIFAKYQNDADEHCFYFTKYDKETDAEYMGRYSWTASADESYCYMVYIDPETKEMRYVLEEAYDEVLINYEEVFGGKPMPIYGDWEMLLD